MTAIRRMRVVWGSISVATVLLLCMTGCSTLTSGSGLGIQTGSQDVAAMTPLYYDFPDVLVPGELKPDRKTSYIVQSHGFSAGVLSFKGRVERGSVIAFFKENMAKDNWKSIGSFASSRTILLFHKENRWCVINITEGDSRVEIGVIPMIGDPSGLMK